MLRAARARPLTWAENARGGVIVFVRQLGSVWARSLPAELTAGAVTPGEDAQEWLSRVGNASAAAAADFVAEAEPEQASSAARWLLSEAISALARPGNVRWDVLAEQGVRLLRIMEHGRGIDLDLPARRLAAAHSRMLIGLGRHLIGSPSSLLAYQESARAYLSRGESLLSSLADLGAETAGRPLYLGDQDQEQIRARLGAVAAASPGAAAELEPALQGYLRTLRAIAVLGQRSQAGWPHFGGLAEADVSDETISLFTVLAWSSVEDAPAAARLARAADEMSRLLGRPDGLLKMLGCALARQRRWPDATALLEECRARHPEDREVVVPLAGTWAESGRWSEARALLAGLLADPPGPQDVEVLTHLRNMAALQNDPEARHWEDLLARLDPSRTTASLMPTSMIKAPGQPQGVVFRDGELFLLPELNELPEAERPVHIAAAMIAGVGRHGPQLLAELEASDPAMAGRVMDLLGIERLTEEQGRVRQHIEAGEGYFARNQFEAAAAEYQRALDIDPDEPMALLYLGDTCYRRGMHHMAQAYFEESIAVAPSPQAYRFLGDAIDAADGSPARARQCYQEALRLDPSYGGARMALDQINVREGGSEETERRPGRPAADEAAGNSPTASRPSAAARDRRPDRRRSPTSPAPSLDGTDRLPTLPRPDTGEGSVGDRLARAAAKDYPVLSVIDDDARFGQWLATAPPTDIAVATKVVEAVAFQYEAKDRDLSRAAHWVHREVQLAEALPTDFGPAQSPFEIGRDRLLADAYASHGEVLYSLGRLPEARRWWERAVELLKAEQAARDAARLAGEPEFDRLFSLTDHQAERYERLAQVCQDLGDEEALQEYSRLAWERNSARLTDESMIGQFIQWGNAALSAGRTDDALQAFHAALEKAEEHERRLIPRPLIASLNALGQCHRLLGLQRTALQYHTRALRLDERSGNAIRLTNDFLQIGRVYRARPDLGDAQQALEQALIHASVPTLAADGLTWAAGDETRYRVTDTDRARAPLLELGGFHEDRGDLAAAVRFLDLATRIADVAWAAATDDAERVAIANQRFAAFAALTRVYLRQAVADEGQAAAEDAWRANEAMRARSFLDALGDDPLAVPAEVPAELAEQEAEALERRRILISSGNTGGRDLAFWDALGRARADLDAIWDRMLAAAPTAAGYIEVRQAKPASVAETRQAIAADPRPTVLASLTPLGQDRLAVLALRSDRAGITLASRPADVSRLTRFISQNLGSSGRVRELAEDLGDLFEHEMGPLTSALAEVSEPGDMLIVCPFGALNYLPLAALRLPDLPLVERNPLAVLPTASMIRALRTALGTPAAIPAMVFGDPTGDLAGARDEAIKIGALYGTTPRLGPTASRAAVGSALATAAIVHIAAHARFDTESPLASGIQLADGTLSAQEIITMSAPALSLVTLSACETGISKTNPAQELLGLTRALLFAGADSLVVSLWKVPDAATTGIMSDFYTSLQRGTGKGDALQTAVLGARERYGAKRFDQWAGFELIGEWR